MARNVLLVVVDDLRPNIAAHGSAFMVTPHMDALAASGVLFQRAYAQYSLCGPSRTSFLSGRRPDATRAWSFQNHFREGVGADWTSLPGPSVSSCTITKAILAPTSTPRRPM